LDIFAQRARSRDGKLQVELAQLKYALPRLGEKDDALSRLSGGIGGRGPGETKLEMGRRRVRERIHRLEREIEQLAKQRQIRRGRREKSKIPVVAIIGYTNAGKSTLLNAMTKAEVLAEDKLFATLDPTSRRIRVPEWEEVILTDTVGFIRDLPQDLIRAFRATLEELAEADLLLHLIDISDPEWESKAQQVEQIVADLTLSQIPTLLVFNKADQIDALAAEQLAARHDALLISALHTDTLPRLLARIQYLLSTAAAQRAIEGESGEEEADVEGDEESQALS
jgi:GTP-binding protein HflX